MLITKLIRMLNTKLCALARSINHLWVVIVSLGIDLLTRYSFWENTTLLLVDNFLLAIWKILSTSLFETLEVLLSWSNDSFLWVRRTYVIIIVSFGAGDSIGCRSYC